MPREFLIKMTAPQELTGVPPGTVLRRFSVDCDEYTSKGLGVVVDKNPPPRNYLLSGGVVDPGVLSGSQTRQTPAEREAEQQFLQAQVTALDQKHTDQVEQKKLKDAVQTQRKVVAHE